MARRCQLVIMISAEKQRLANAQDRVAQSSFKAVLKRLEAERARIDRAIDKLIEASPLWCAKQDLLKSVPGIGNVVARTLDRRTARARPGRSPPDRRPNIGSTLRNLTAAGIATRCGMRRLAASWFSVVVPSQTPRLILLEGGRTPVKHYCKETRLVLRIYP